MSILIGIYQDAKVDSMVSRIQLFQDTFNLTVDGTLNNETLPLNDRRTCGTKDEVLPFSAKPTKKVYTNEIT